MTSHESTSGFNFWSRGHLRMTVMHLPIKFGAGIFIQSRVIDIFFSKIKDVGCRHLGFDGGAMGAPTKTHSLVVPTPCKNSVMIG